MLKRLNFILFVCFCNVFIVASGQDYSWEIVSSEENTLVESGGKWHALLGSTGLVKFHLEDGEISEFNSAKLTQIIDGNELSIDINKASTELANGKLLVTIDIVEKLSVLGTYANNLDLSYKIKSGETKDVSIQLPSITIWNIPSATTDRREFALINGDKVSLTVNPQGGYDKGWVYIWNNSYETDSPTFNFSAVNNTKNESVVVYPVEAKNIAPDGKTVWGTILIEFGITIFPTPKVVYPSESTISLSVFSKQPTDLQVEVEGGVPDGWEFSWYKEKNLIQSGTETTLNIEEELEGTYTYRVDVVNKCEGQVRFQESCYYRVVVWPSANAKMETEYPTNLIVGDKVDMSIISSGGDPNKWTYSWYENDEKLQISGAKSQFVAKKLSSKNCDEYRYLVKATNSPENCLIPYEYEYSHIFNVWDTPKVVDKSPSEQYCVGGSDFNLFVSTSGGKDDGWKYQWTLNGEKIGTNAELSISPKNETTEKKEFNYSVEVVNECEGVVRFKEIYNFVVIVWPNTIIEIDQEYDAYYGETIVMKVNTSGGNSQGWTYEWDSSSKSNSKVYIVPERDVDNTYSEHYVTIKNTYKQDGDLFNKTYFIKVNEWSRGELIEISSDSLDVLSGHEINLMAQTKGGYTAGWSFDWYKDGELFASEKTPEITLQLNNTSNNYQSIDYSVEATNKITESNIGCDKEYKTIELRVWPKISTPTYFNNTISQIRENNILNLSINPATGGYTPNGASSWKYRWTIDGNVISSSTNMSSKVALRGTGKGKQTQPIKCKVEIENEGPNSGVYWCRETLEQDIVVYRRPMTPYSLARKGSGNSCTMILQMANLSDTEIDTYEYEFVYGYTDRYGDDHKSAPTSKRYYQFDSNIYNDRYNIFWVIAQWKYDDAIITSGKRFLSGSVDESYDGSEYDLSSRGPAYIEEIEAKEPIVVEGGTIKVSSLEPVMAAVKIYTMSGALVKAYDFVIQSEAQIDLGGLAKGVYFVEIVTDGEKISKKILL